jgi:hypothetical protein
MNSSDEKVADEFWNVAGAMLIGYMAAMRDIEPADVITIIDDIMRRCDEIPAVICTSAKSAKFGLDLAALLIDLVSAEQRLMESRTGRLPGQMVGDWPPTPISFEHPFLIAIQRVVNQIEAEANKGKYKRPAN